MNTTKKMDAGTKVRSIVLFLALLNQFLVSTGLNPIPGSEELWGEVISWTFVAIASIWAWFMNNYLTWKGKRQKEALEKQRLI
jgi:SPP1 family holin